MKNLFLLTSVLCCFLQSVYSQAGAIDASFGTKGIVKTDVGSPYNYELIGKQVLLQSDGSIYVLLLSQGQTLIAKKHSNGSADSTYGLNGFSSLMAIAPVYAALQPDGKIVVAGTLSNSGSDVSALTRYNTNGSVDNTFNRNGTQTINFSVASVAVQTDGKIVVAGSATDTGNSYFAVARYNIDGSADVSFSNDGKQITSFGFSRPPDMGGDYPEGDIGYSVAIQGDGKIVVAGEALNYANGTREFAVARYKTDGELDNTFSSDGKQTTNFGSDDYAYSIAFQKDGRIVLAGYAVADGSNYNIAVARYNTDGSLDKIFDGDGKQTTDVSATERYPNSVVVQDDGKIVVEAVSWNGNDNDFTIVRYNTNGSLDTTFDNDGKLRTDFGTTDDYTNSLSIQSDGKIVVEGYSYTYTNTGANSAFALARYNTNGSLDNTFDKDGKLTEILHQGYTIYSSTAVQKDGKIIAAGYSWNGSNNSFVIARYSTNGKPDSTFDKDGIVLTSMAGDSYANSVAIQSDGKIVAAGDTWNGSNNDFALVRYNTDGSIDNTFGSNGKITTDITSNDDFANSIAIQSDGKILVAGYANTGTVNNVDFAIARYNTDGSLDNTFSSDGKQITDFNSSNDFGYSVAIQSDGKILIAGYTNAGSPNNADFGIVRYNPDGSLDNTFDTDGKQTTDFGSSDNYANSMAIQSDGKIVVAGRNGDYGMYKLALARYNTSGTLDQTFSSDGKQETGFGLSDVYANAIAIQTDGKIVTGGSSNDNFAVARFKPDGSVDTTFSNDGIQITPASAGEDRIQGIAIANNKLYVTGFGQYPGNFGVVAKYSLNQGLAPTVSITSPANNAVYYAPATIKITAAAKDSDGTISSVKFYNGSTYLKTVFASPYTYSLGNVPAGTYSLTAKATDNAGLQTISSAVVVKVLPNKAPVVKITSPANNAIYYAPATISISATASDSDGTVSNVKFYNGSVLLKTDSTSPYTYTWSNVAAGTYSLTAKAMDNHGLVTTSSVVKVSVLANKAPVVKITSPLSNAVYYAPATINISATASDSDGTVSNVKFYHGSVLIKTDSTSPYTYTWTNVAAGNYSLTAKAMDNHGVVTTSSAVKITVLANKAPIVKITSPANNAVYTAPATINISATASDSDGTVSNVKFYHGSVLIKTDSTSPYTCTWSNVAAGSYSLTAKAMDNHGLVTTSSAIQITVASNKSSDINTASDSNLPITLKVGPNPAANILNIYTDGLKQNKQLTISIISMSGVLFKESQFNSPQSIVQLDVSALTRGVYVVKVICGDEVLYKQFVKL